MDGPAQAYGSRGASADHKHSSRASSAQLAPLQRSSSEATAALSATSRAPDENPPLQYHSHHPGGSPLREAHHWEEHGGHALGDIPELAPSNYVPDRCAARQNCCCLHVLCMPSSPQATCPWYCPSVKRTALAPCPIGLYMDLCIDDL